MMEFAEPIRLVIWDLDDTFWHGTLEEGPVAVPPEHCDIVRALAKRGIVSAICSRNDPATAKAQLETCGMWEWFVFPRIGYTFKSDLVNDIVEQSALRPETVLFIDDNPFNRADVAERLSDIHVADASIIPELLDHPQLQGKPDEQLMRLTRYRVLESRQAEFAIATDRTAFLRSCEIAVSVHFDVENHFERIHELVNRTNQLNFTRLRWPEDVERARKEWFDSIRNTYGSDAGYVKVRDRYGYYGICGFFETRRRARVAGLRHFLFSCRVLNMGVEQFLYQHLDFPKLKKGSGAVSELSESQIVDWIALVADAEPAEAAPARQSGLTLCLHGPCEFVQSAHYLRSDVAVIEEFHYPRQGWQIMRPLLRNIVLKDELEQRGLSGCADLGLPDDFPGIDFSAFGSAFLDGCADICAWSFSMQALEGLYRHRATGLLFPLSIRTARGNVEDITSLALSANESRKISRRDHSAVQSSFEWFGFMDRDRFVADLRVLRQKLQALGKPFVVLEAFDDLTKIDKPTYRKHAVINRLVRDGLAGLDNVYYIRFSDCVKDSGDQFNENHFVRDVYMKLASRIRELILAIGEPGSDHGAPMEIVSSRTGEMMSDAKEEAAPRSALSQLPKKHLGTIFRGTMRYSWRGVRCNKSPFDLALYPLLIWQQKPRTIIEFGTKQGGSALWFHDTCRAFGLDTRIISVDIDQRANLEVEGITFLSGDALRPEKVLPDEFMAQLPRPLLVIDDSAHLPSTVLSILRFMDGHLRIGEYIVIEDGIVQSMGIDGRFDGGPSPAIEQFLAERPGHYAVDTRLCDFFGTNVTFNPNGYLVKTGGARPVPATKAVAAGSPERGWDVMRRLEPLRGATPGGPKLQAIRAAIGEVRLRGDFAQFGVYRGHTAQLIARLTTDGRKLHLFDSFEGLPEDWTETKKAGHFRLAPDEIPAFDPAVAVIHKGWFKDTVPPFAAGRTAPLAFLHMDADLYSSTVDVLFNANAIIADGTIILFDEYAIRKWQNDDEHRAFVDWVKAFDRRFDYLWTIGFQVCVRITG